jgi:hypothetical protein
MPRGERLAVGAEQVDAPVIVGLGNGELITGVVGNEQHKRRVGIDDLGADAIAFQVLEPPVDIAAALVVAAKLTVLVVLVDFQIGYVQAPGVHAVEDDITAAVALFHSGNFVAVLGRNPLVVKLRRFLDVRVGGYNLWCGHRFHSLKR